ncbi:aminoglycoside 6-adenylyltransferase [Virgibacillus kekensis]|uniref:Aminoglycoside 6-adenylyltransferase n=1 Tax=Virgibacillus kekensis TaxID=202261 RepID=A0ABV9DNF7_9BACI
MYSVEERKTYFENTIQKLDSSNLIEGVIQLGSGVIGYKDEYSDIDLMVCTSKVEDTEATKDFVYQTLSGFNPIYFKEKKFSENIFLLIAIISNRLEFNISIVPRDLLTVRSPLWKIILDKTGLVTEKMDRENEQFENKSVKYDVQIDLPFEFAYCAMSLEKEIKRNNLIYAEKMLENMRNYTLLVQAMNEGKKLHQFKAYETLTPTFVKDYLSTFPEKITVDNLMKSSERLKDLFTETIRQSSAYSIDRGLEQLMNS